MAEYFPHLLNPNVTFPKDNEKDLISGLVEACFLPAGLIKHITHPYKVCPIYLLAIPSTAIQLKKSLAYRGPESGTYASLPRTSTPLGVEHLDFSKDS